MQSLAELLHLCDIHFRFVWKHWLNEWNLSSMYCAELLISPFIDATHPAFTGIIKLFPRQK